MALRRCSEWFVGGAISSALNRWNTRHPWSHNDHFHSWILANLPAHRHRALDVGCGRGELLAALAPHFSQVHGNDIDADVRRLAVSRNAGLSNVTIDGGDWTRLPSPFDLVTMVAVLHHLDVAAALGEVRRLLSPGGRFLALGLAPPVSVTDHAWDLASALTNPIIGMIKHPWPSADGAERPPFPTKDPTMPFNELLDVVTAVMPGAVLRHRLAFRHTIAWTKPT